MTYRSDDPAHNERSLSNGITPHSIKFIYTYILCVCARASARAHTHTHIYIYSESDEDLDFYHILY